MISSDYVDIWHTTLKVPPFETNLSGYYSGWKNCVSQEQLALAITLPMITGEAVITQTWWRYYTVLVFPINCTWGLFSLYNQPVLSVCDVCVFVFAAIGQHRGQKEGADTRHRLSRGRGLHSRFTSSIYFNFCLKTPVNSKPTSSVKKQRDSWRQFANANSICKALFVYLLSALTRHWSDSWKISISMLSTS